MSPSRIVLTLLGATLSVAASAAPPAVATQPDFVPLRGKDPGKSQRPAKPSMAAPVAVQAHSEMQAVVGRDGRITYQCRDLAHAHAQSDAGQTPEAK